MDSNEWKREYLKPGVTWKYGEKWPDSFARGATRTLTGLPSKATGVERCAATGPAGGSRAPKVSLLLEFATPIEEDGKPILPPGHAASKPQPTEREPAMVCFGGVKYDLLPLGDHGRLPEKPDPKVLLTKGDLTRGGRASASLDERIKQAKEERAAEVAGPVWPFGG